MYQQNNKRAVICGVAVLPLLGISMSAPIGRHTVTITGSGGVEYYRVQSASFSEKKAESGDYVEQEMECIFTDTSQESVEEKMSFTTQEILVLLKYSNGQVKVIGTDLAPVRANIEISGTPLTVRIAFKRKSPEFSKFLQSLN